jgi:hypothetical protein
MIITDLAGSYDTLGVRSWFNRPRSALNGNRPADILTGSWDPNSSDVQLVRQLAAAQSGSPTGRKIVPSSP